MERAQPATVISRPASAMRGSPQYIVRLSPVIKSIRSFLLYVEPIQQLVLHGQQHHFDKFFYKIFGRDLRYLAGVHIL